MAHVLRRATPCHFSATRRISGLVGCNVLTYDTSEGHVSEAALAADGQESLGSQLQMTVTDSRSQWLSLRFLVREQSTGFVTPALFSVAVKGSPHSPARVIMCALITRSRYWDWRSGQTTVHVPHGQHYRVAVRSGFENLKNSMFQCTFCRAIVGASLQKTTRRARGAGRTTRRDWPIMRWRAASQREHKPRVPCMRVHWPGGARRGLRPRDVTGGTPICAGATVIVVRARIKDLTVARSAPLRRAGQGCAGHDGARRRASGAAIACTQCRRLFATSRTPARSTRALRGGERAARRRAT